MVITISLLISCAFAGLARLSAEQYNEVTEKVKEYQIKFDKRYDILQLYTNELKMIYERINKLKNHMEANEFIRVSQILESVHNIPVFREIEGISIPTVEFKIKDLKKTNVNVMTTAGFISPGISIAQLIRAQFHKAKEEAMIKAIDDATNACNKAIDALSELYSSIPDYYAALYFLYEFYGKQIKKAEKIARKEIEYEHLKNPNKQSFKESSYLHRFLYRFIPPP